MPERRLPYFTVWAPFARRVEIELTSADGDAVTGAMKPAADGWWVYRGERATAYPLDYAFRLGGEGPIPDPRSAWQPMGVHGPSRTFDATLHHWQDLGWRGPRGGTGALGGVFYEMHVGTFTEEGTFGAATGRLGHLVELGVDLVELMPVAAFPGRWGWGYDGVHPYAVHEPYGGPRAFQRFVDACHQNGLGVCLDVVYNHLGPSGNYLGQFGPYFTEAHLTPWGPGVNFDGIGSENVRRWVVDNALRWFRDFHVDALRLDAVHELRDDSERHIVAQLSDETASLGAELDRELTLVAESDLNDPMMVTPTSAGGLGMSGQWADDIHHALHTVLTGESKGYYADFAQPGVLAKTLTEVFLHDGRWSSFRGRPWGAPVDRSVHSGRQFLAYLKTHDQVGNRATGDRISASVTPGQQAIGAALYPLSAFTPMIFMGEEWAASTPWQFFTDFEEPALAQAVREGRRREFAAHGWDVGEFPGAVRDEVPDPQNPATRARSVLDWTEVGQGEHARMLGWYRALTELRRREPHLHDGRLGELQVTSDDEQQWLVMTRSSLHVAVNFARTARTVPHGHHGGTPEEVLAWEGETTRLVGHGIHLGAHGVAVLREPH